MDAESRKPDTGAGTQAEQVIQVRKLNKSFGELHVLRDFDLELNKGENLVVIGKSGSGKSVLVRCIIGLVKPDSGTINVLDNEVTELDHDALDKLRQKVGFLFQSNALYDSMTIRENLEFPLRRHGKEKTKEEVDQLVMEALESVDLADTIDKMPSELSGGLKKRIALARTLILKPEIILYDEPTTGLDSITGKEISNLMVDLRSKYRTSSVIISHDLNCVRIASDRIVMLIDGKCYATGTYGELRNSPDPAIKQFFE